MKITINGEEMSVEDGTTVAAAILNSGTAAFRTSVKGEARAALCGMGICFECRITLNGTQHVRSCNLAVHDGMEIITGE